MNRVTCKICRIVDLRSARLAGWVGADMIGLHAIKSLPVEKELLFRDICARLRAEGGPATALLTKVTDISEITRMVAAVAPTHLQLHEPWTADGLHTLRHALKEAGLSAVQLIAVVSVDDANLDAIIDDAKREVEYLLFDRWEGGTGLAQEESRLKSALKRARPLPAFLAGGLNPANVEAKVRRLGPYGVDVQTGVEVPGGHGEKDFVRVARFIQKARGRSSGPGLDIVIPPSTRVVSMSLTDVAPVDLEATIHQVENAADLFHLDHSDGTLAPGFLASHVETARRLYEVSPSSIYDVHAFVDVEQVVDTADGYLTANPMLRVVFVHLDLERKGAMSIQALRRLAAALQHRGVSMGIALQAPKQLRPALQQLLRFMEGSMLRELSIVGPKDGSTLDVYEARVGGVLRAVRGWGGTRTYGVGIDRLVTIEKAAIAGALGATRAVVGASGIRSATCSPVEYLDAARSAVTAHQ